MSFFRVILAAVVAFLSVNSAVRAEDAPAKAFVPLSASYKNMQGASMPPHFFPLKGRQISRFIPHAGSVTAQKPHEIAPQTAREDDMPVLRNKAPEEMSKDQANQILSIFGGR